MSPDDLIVEFKKLAKEDPSIRIDRTEVGDVDEIRLAAWNDVRTKHRFEGLAADAVAHFAPLAQGDRVITWLWTVWSQAPELVEDGGPRGALGYAKIGDIGGPLERVPFVAKTIPHAASASVLVVRRLRDAQRRREQMILPDPRPVDEAAVEALLGRYGTLESALIVLSRGHSDLAFSFALTWVHSRCTWSSERNGAELWHYIGQLSRGEIVDAEIRELVVTELRRLDTTEHRRAFWTEVLARFPNAITDSQSPPDAKDDVQPRPDDATLDDLITLDQAAAMVGLHKRTMERYVGDGRLPPPDIRGGGGKANKWYWRKILPALREHFRPDLPEKFPGSRIVG